METKHFFCVCLGVDGKVIDDICNEFDVELTDKDVLTAIQYSNEGNPWGAGIYLLEVLFFQIVEQYECDLDRDRFDYDFSSPSYPIFYYNNERFAHKEDLDAIVERMAA